MRSGRRPWVGEPSVIFLVRARMRGGKLITVAVCRAVFPFFFIGLTGLTTYVTYA